MKTLKQLIRTVPPLRWLDDFTDTTLGENVTWALAALAVLLWIAWRNQ